MPHSPSNLERHHIRRWSQQGRTKAGDKVQTFAWECGPCKARGESTSKSQRDREIDNHKREAR